MEENINISEQWKLEGDCEKCERKENCKNKCSNRKNKEYVEIRKKILELFKNRKSTK